MYDREGAWHRVHIRFVWFVLTMQDSCWWRAEGEWPHAGSNGNLEKTIKESKANQQEKNESNPSSSSPPTIILFNCISALLVDSAFDESSHWMITSLEKSWKTHWTCRIQGAVKESGPRIGGIPHRDRREAARTVRDQGPCRTAVTSLRPKKDTWRGFWTNTQIYFKAGRTGNRGVVCACLHFTFTATFKPE